MCPIFISFTVHAMRVLFLKVLRYMRHACPIFRVLSFLKFYDICVFPERIFCKNLFQSSKSGHDQRDKHFPVVVY